MGAPIAALIANQKVLQPTFALVNLALLFVLYVVFWMVLQIAYARWPGRKSRLQVLRDLGSSHPSLFGEAVFELGRRIRREPALKEYIEPQQQFDLDLPTEPIESLAWIDAARDLVC
jgi:hypothetical protein